MPKRISLTGLKARDKAISGLNYVADAIESTIGPFGLNFLLEKGNRVTNDGYTISSALCPTIQDEFERRGALVAQEASSKTNEIVGDATSTAWSLTKNIVKEAIRYLPNEKSIKAKKTPSEVIKMIKDAKDIVLTHLQEMTTPVESKEALIKSAMVSVENEEIAELLGSMQWELGPEGVILAEEVNDTTSSIERVKGIRLDNGFGTSQIINNPEKQSLEVSDMPILLTNHTIGTEEMMKLKESVFKYLINSRKLGIIVVARAFTNDAIRLCMESMNAGFAIFPVNAPYVNQTEVMKDIQAVVGGRYIDSESGTIDDIYIGDVGFAKKFIARITDGIVTGTDNEDAQKRAEERADEIRKKLQGEESEFHKKMLEARIAQLSNGFAILKVGSHSVTDRKRLKDKCDDAVNAVRLALKGGTVPGGGKAFKEISDKLSEDNILKRPITSVYDRIMSSAPEGWEIEEWVRDPYLVLKTALEQSCIFAGTFSSTYGIETSKNEPECNCNKQVQEQVTE